MPDASAETVEHLVRSKLAEALGGRRGIVESAVPTIAFATLATTELTTTYAAARTKKSGIQG